MSRAVITVYDGLSAGKVKEEVKALIQDEEKTRARAGALDEIQKSWPCTRKLTTTRATIIPMEYFRTEMKLRGLDPTTTTVQDLRDTYRNLRAAGIPLRLKQDVVRQQREEKNGKEADDIKAREHFDESEAYAMPMNELVRRAGGIF